MVICGKCEFSRRIKERNHLPRLEYECFADMPVYGSSTVMGVKNGYGSEKLFIVS
jgi:hypothetical protein